MKKIRPSSILQAALLFAALAIITTLAGCGSVPVQVKAGADPVVVHAEWLAENSLGSIDSFLAFERMHEKELVQRDPGIHRVADQLRDNGETAIAELRSITKQYKLDRSAENGSRVKAATVALLALVNSARRYQGLPPLILPTLAPSATDLMLNAPTNGPPAP